MAEQKYYDENCGYSDYGKEPCGEYAECLWCPNHPDKRKSTNDLA